MQSSGFGVEEEAVASRNGLVEVASGYSFDDTVGRLQRAFGEKGLEIFAVIDHSGEAAKVGLKMSPTKVLIFGSPKCGDSADGGGSEHRH